MQSLQKDFLRGMIISNNTVLEWFKLEEACVGHVVQLHTKQCQLE